MNRQCKVFPLSKQDGWTKRETFVALELTICTHINKGRNRQWYERRATANDLELNWS